jgi:hypothetical protein
MRMDILFVMMENIMRRANNKVVSFIPSHVFRPSTAQEDVLLQILK